MLLSSSRHSNTRSLNNFPYLLKWWLLSINFILISLSIASLCSFKALQTFYPSLSVKHKEKFFHSSSHNQRSCFTLQDICSFFGLSEVGYGKVIFVFHSFTHWNSPHLFFIKKTIETLCSSVSIFVIECMLLHILVLNIS